MQIVTEAECAFDEFAIANLANGRKVRVASAGAKQLLAGRALAKHVQLHLNLNFLYYYRLCQ
ncbi:hypothetical protein GCM10009109_06850 [Marinobacterium sediminicola]